LNDPMPTSFRMRSIMAQKFRNKNDLEIVAPSRPVIDSGEKRQMSNGRTRNVGFYASSNPASIDVDLVSQLDREDQGRPIELDLPPESHPVNQSGEEDVTPSELSSEDSPGPYVLESCHSSWLFDIPKMRFQRRPKGLAPSVVTPWQKYYEIRFDEDSNVFLVFLNRQKTRLLRSWIHDENCKECGGNQTGEVSPQNTVATADGTGSDLPDISEQT
jgi:hypothetical protein